MSVSDWIKDTQDRVVRSGITARFQTYDPEQLWAMVSAADGSTPKELGDLLTAAAKTIRQIGSDLRDHSMAVEWDGEAGDAFRKWCHKAAMTTLRLGDYSESAGKWMSHAADTLYEVKPQIESLRNQTKASQAILNAHSANNADVGNHGGGSSDAEVKSAKSQYSKDHADAAQLMTKLAQSYSASTEQIQKLEAPKFPELPERFVPQAKNIDSRGDLARDAYTGASTPSPGSIGAHAVPASPAGSGTTHPAQVTPPDTSPLPPSRPVGTEIDSVVAPPEPPTAPVAPSPGTPPVGRPDGAAPPPLAVPPLPGRPGPVPEALPTGRPTTGGRAPLPPSQGAMPGRGTPRPVGGDNGIIGGRQVPSANRPSGPVPRGTVIGETPRPGQATVGRPTTPGIPGGTGGAPGPRPGAPPSNGIVGTPRPTTSGGTPGAPRNATPAFRGVVGTSHSPEPRQQAAARTAGSPTAGGVTGGVPRPAAQGRSTGFTSGGSGLVRSEGGASDPTRPGQRPHEGSASPTDQHSPPQSHDRSSGRSGYATEPEETWYQDRRRPIPPVIE